MNNAREALFRAAMELTAERGLYGFSLQDVAARTGTSRALIIHHFSSKEAFLDALVALLLDSEAEPVRFESAVEELALHVSNGLVEGLGDPVATRARIAVLCSAGPESKYHDQAQRWWRSRQDAYRDLLRAASAAGQITGKFDGSFNAVAVASLEQGALLASASMSSTRHEQFRSAVVDLLLRAVMSQLKGSGHLPAL